MGLKATCGHRLETCGRVSRSFEFPLVTNTWVHSRRKERPVFMFAFKLCL